MPDRLTDEQIGKLRAWLGDIQLSNQLGCPQYANPGELKADLRVLLAERETHAVQRDVEEFHRALDVLVGDTPAIRRPELRATLIEEEARETVEAIRAGDLVQAIDGLCDLLCVVYGAAVEFGVNLAPFWDEVHRTNMAKAGGPVREDGKRLKPDGWQPPRIAEMLVALEGASGE